ncbi:phosphatase PAP2 family protein [Aureibaculum sp. A20]|uniref:Phosphatase PAP2 family protein n=1 Tax=Aureibaculum flavum TaxID=2795986 RepID=A0ABS0WPU3_9FLAO|nr:phosphatase PAP2 family protein [Aureibaculum flavum]MBJ2173946.1 phosphatase PAP2 family protein [Aureibaculum flavum]
MKKIFLLLIILSSIYTYSQTDTTAYKKNRVWKALKYDGNVALKSMVNSFTQPMRWKGDDFLTVGGIIAGAGIMYLGDNEANSFFVNQGKDVPRFVKKIGFYGGKPQTFFLVSASVYGLGLITDNVKIRRTGVLIITSAATSGLIQSISKNVFGRARPSIGNHNEFKPFSKDAGFHSFPSGHAVLSFSMAHSIAKQFDNIWVKAGIYSVGSIVPISRLWANAHWFSDVGLGLVISIVTVDSIDNFMKKKGFYNYSKPKKISWSLKAGFGTIGVVGTF